jgi:WD40 repeat protein
MIVDPAGWNVPDNASRPILPRNLSFDSGVVLNSFGRETGHLSVSCTDITLSRDASIGVRVTSELETRGDNNHQYYASMLYPDGSFKDIPFEERGNFVGAISQDGNIMAFFRVIAPSSDEESYVEVIDRNGSIVNNIQVNSHFGWIRPIISANGNFATVPLTYIGGCITAVNCITGEIIPVSYNAEDVRGLQVCQFSPDGSYLCMTSGNDGIIIDLISSQKFVYPITTTRQNPSYETDIHCSNYRTVIAILTEMEATSSIESIKLRLLVGDKEIRCVNLMEESYLGRGLHLEVSPNGDFVLVYRKLDRLDGTTPSLVIHISGRK